MTPSNLPADTVNRLRAVVEDWGREVTGAQQRLQQQIAAASSELSNIEGLLARRLQGPTTEELLREIQALQTENRDLRQALAERDARIEGLTQGSSSG